VAQRPPLPSRWGSMLPSVTTFADAFPSVKHATIEVTEGDPMRTRRWPTLTEATAREYVSCSNPHCCNGGISIGDLIRGLVRKGQSEGTVTSMCKGYEGSPKGQRIDRLCIHTFKVHVLLKYKSEDEPTEPPGN
jgi:hypothetical protein